MATGALHGMATAAFDPETGFYFPNPEDAQKRISTCLSALPLVFFKKFDGFFISAITALLEEEIHRQRPYESKLYRSLQRSLAPAKDEKDGTTPGVTEALRLRLLAYWLTLSSRNWSLPDSWIREIERRPEWHDIITWDPNVFGPSSFPVVYGQQTCLMWPKEQDVAKMDVHSRDFRDVVLGIHVSKATLHSGMTFKFAVGPSERRLHRGQKKIAGLVGDLNLRDTTTGLHPCVFL